MGGKWWLENFGTGKSIRQPTGRPPYVYVAVVVIEIRVSIIILYSTEENKD